MSRSPVTVDRDMCKGTKMSGNSRTTEQPRRRPRWILPAAAVLAIGAGLFGWQSFGSTPATPRAAAAPAVPVDVAVAVREDVPLYLTGLGTVQAFNTVTVHVRVDGELQKVSFTEGQVVKAGDVLAEIDPRPFQAALDGAEAKKAQDEATLANAKRDLARYQSLARSDFVTRQTYDTQQATVAQTEAALRGDQAAIDNARVQLGYTTITSPINGRTGIRLVDQGNIVHATDANGLVVITQLKPISVIFTLPEDDLPELSQAMSAGPVQVLAMSGDSNTQLDEGKVALIDNEINQATGTLRLKATFPNESLRLWPGQFVDVRLRLNTLRNVVTVPSAAILRSAEGLSAYVAGADNRVTLRRLKVGSIADGTTVIEDGIAPGERVVTSGQYRLVPGTLVAFDPPKAAQALATQESRP
jgi:membrane fusion protein, multidrug efflux system